jgi:hypothetical protein
MTTWTVWDLLDSDEKATQATQPPRSASCPTCGQPFQTEADASRHYSCPEPQYCNLGYCPQRPAYGLETPAVQSGWLITVRYDDGYTCCRWADGLYQIGAAIVRLSTDHFDHGSIRSIDAY